MGKASTAKRQVEVTLVCADTGAKSFTLPAGATLGDLLREAGATADGAHIMIDGRPIEEALTLKSGTNITILPAPRTPAKLPWRDTVGIFADDPTFEEAVAAERAIREVDRKATLEEMDREEAARADS
jgi:hypothetical protein